MIRANYRRKGRRYVWQTTARDLSVAQVKLLARAGVRVLGIIWRSAGFIVTRVNAIGIVDTAAFPDRSRAMKWLYGAARNASPQLSLFQGAV